MCSDSRTLCALHRCLFNAVNNPESWDRCSLRKQAGIQVSRTQDCCSVSESFPTLQLPGLQYSRLPLSFIISQSLLKLMSIELVMPSILCCPLLLLPSTFPSIRVFSNELALPISRRKDWSFSTSPSNYYSGLISLGLTDLISLLKLMSIESVMPSVTSSSVVPFSCLQSFPASGSFPVSQFFTSGGQNIGV